MTVNLSHIDVISTYLYAVRLYKIARSPMMNATKRLKMPRTVIEKKRYEFEVIFFLRIFRKGKKSAK